MAWGQHWPSMRSSISSSSASAGTGYAASQESDTEVWTIQQGHRHGFGIGDRAIMRRKCLRLMCSVQCPGSVVIKTFDAIRELRDAGVVVVGDFHSPMEKDHVDPPTAERVHTVATLLGVSADEWTALGSRTRGSAGDHPEGADRHAGTAPGGERADGGPAAVPA